MLSGDRDQTFIWYLLPTIPFLCLALGFFAALAWERMATRVAAGAYALVLVASFGFYLPLLVALPISPDAWRLHVPFRDCAGQTLPDDTTSQGSPAAGVVLDLRRVGGGRFHPVRCGDFTAWSRVGCPRDADARHRWRDTGAGGDE